MLKALKIQKSILKKPFIIKKSSTWIKSTCFHTNVAQLNDTFNSGTTRTYMEAMHESWIQDPKSVHISWQVYFQNLESGILPQSSSFIAPPTIAQMPGTSIPQEMGNSPGINNQKGDENVLNYLKIQLMIRAYQVRGHHLAKLDPLGIEKADLGKENPKELDIDGYEFPKEDMDKEFELGPGIFPYIRESGVKKMTLRKIIDTLKRIYCSSIGYEYQHIPDKAQCDWIRKRIETPEKYNFSLSERKIILDRLIWSDSFERFVATKYVSEKRFGLEGCESLIPGMKALIDRSVDLGLKSVVIGMPHRGRLNVLSNVVRKPNESIFCEFSGSMDPSVEGSGDVKYHLGMSYIRPTPSGKKVNLSLVANPSHLEAVNPVVLGKVRAIQYYSDDLEKHDQSMALLLHGDAAFAGQGVVYETLGFSELPSYSTGGTIHMIVNNQVGFTTDPRFSRSTAYCSDIAKSINAPIFHVNGDDPEAVTFVCQLAADWRQTFKKDVVIDIVCYRKHGHNEVDQPSFTQPKMYQIISKIVSTLDKYTKRLVEERAVDDEYIKENKKKVWKLLEESYAKSKDYKPTTKEWLSSVWPGFKAPSELAVQIVPSYPTGVSKDKLKKIGKVISSYPSGFSVHPILKKIFAAKMKTIDEEAGLDWPTCEGLAFGTLLDEGNHVRLSGQDVERGTFSQRHAVLHDQKTEATFTPLSQLNTQKAGFTVCNSSLSEFGILGFELGFSLVDPKSLVCWEAQFGDFANTAQCIIDQFIAPGEKKWLQSTGLVLLLPHGYDGQGPEHSSGRIERFLQLVDESPDYPTDKMLERQHQDSNIQIVYCSTPANYFHVLRRQICREFRKPLVCFNSKSLLRHPMAKSTFEDMKEGTIFKKIIEEPYHQDKEHELVSKDKIKKHIYCSGQVYYTLLRARMANKIQDVAITRLEQISPFSFDLILKDVNEYPNAELVWCQEEPLNMGSWSYVQPRFLSVLEKSSKKNKSVKPSARPCTSTVATGNKKQHIIEEFSLISKALYGESKAPKDVKNGTPIF